MSEATTNNKRSFKKLTLFKYTSVSLVIAGLAWIISMITTNCFLEVNTDLYARTFMAWRVKDYSGKSGDAAMFAGRYKGYKKNDFPDKKEIKDFLEVAQGKDALLIAGNYPLHAPREPENLWSLYDDVVVDFWRVECALKAKLDGEADIEAYKESARTALKDKTYGSEAFEPKWFRNDTDITSTDLDVIYGSGFINWKNATIQFLQIIRKLVDGEDDYGFVDKGVTSKFEADIRNFAEILGYKDLSKEVIDNFFYNMAVVKASPKETFAYSRLFNLWSFATINHEYTYNLEKISKCEKDLVEIKDADEKKAKELGEDPKKIRKSKKLRRKENECYELQSRERAAVFAQIFAKVYSKPYDFELSESSVKDSFVKMFGTSQDISKVIDEEENIKNALAKAENNVGVASN